MPQLITGRHKQFGQHIDLSKAGGKYLTVSKPS